MSARGSDPLRCWGWQGSMGSEWVDRWGTHHRGGPEGVDWWVPHDLGGRRRSQTMANPPSRHGRRGRIGGGAARSRPSDRLGSVGGGVDRAPRTPSVRWEVGPVHPLRPSPAVGRPPIDPLRPSPRAQGRATDGCGDRLTGKLGEASLHRVRLQEAQQDLDGRPRSRREPITHSASIRRVSQRLRNHGCNASTCRYGTQPVDFDACSARCR